MIRTTTRGLCLGLALLALGCGDDQTGVPQPQPVPGPLSDFVRRSTPALTAEPPQTMVLGLPGAVAGAGRVLLARGSGAELEAIATAAGTFSVVVPGGAGQELSLRFATDEGVSEPLVLPGVYSQGALVLGGVRNGDGQVISPPDGAGNVTVTNDFDPVPLEAAPGVELLAANGRTGGVVVGATDARGRFTLEIPAASGDEVRLMLVDPSDALSTSDLLVLTVP